MGTIKLRGVVAEDFCNYKVPAMFLITSYCDFKCCHEGGFSETVCQNEPLIRDTEVKEFSIDTIIKAYINNPITKAIVFGGMEPMKQFAEVKEFIHSLRFMYNNFDPVVIYTGYYPEEIADKLAILSKFDNIIMKFGRYKPGDEPHYDDVLGIYLVSDNQFAEQL